MIEFKNLTLSRGQKTLLESASLTINPGEKVGLVGSNGTGKSTLLSLLRNEIKEDGGILFVPKQWRISSVLQEVEQTDRAAIDYVLGGDDRWYATNQSLQKAEEDADTQALITLHEHMSSIDGYRTPALAAELMYGLGFSAQQQQHPIKSFSGGWQMRLNLARALMKPCDLLLLDEPTNHLDMDAIAWLERWLERFPGTLILIAHDSVFLDQVVSRIIAVEDKLFLSHKGTYSQFIEWRAERLALQQKVFEQQQRKVAHLQSFITRFKAKASKAKQAQSRMKTLSRMELVACVQANSPFQFTLTSQGECPNPVVQLNSVNIGYNSTSLLHSLHLNIGPGERIGLLGANGAGKSTLVKALAGDLAPLAGEIVKSPNLNIGYFAQHQVDLLNLEETPFWHLNKIAFRADQQTVRSFLGRFGFLGDKVFEQVGVFSGGEKARLVLALLAWQKPHLLLLDEPTNHLDLEMREALALALQEYEGAVLVVSHDRQLLNAVVDSFWLVHDGKVKPYDDDLDAYTQWCFDQRKRVSESVQGPVKSTEQSSSLQQRCEQLEHQVKKLSKDKESLSRQLTDESLSIMKKQSLAKRLSTLELQLSAVEAEWFQLLS